ncbi:hypothetical protein ACIQNI_25555 [Streptomyces sp. NPDC091266]|uniref:hypothetical protein n=1 Tax=Streptomyces sp. NPDC091266 TaxID=3365978 RepID=UPI0037F6D4CE
MPHCIARFVEPLLRLLLPSPGRRTPGPGIHPTAPRATTPRGRLTWEPVLRGEDTVMVRPYLVAYEQRQQEERQVGARPRALRIAVRGLDLGAGVAAR